MDADSKLLWGEEDIPELSAHPLAIIFVFLMLAARDRLFYIKGLCGLFRGAPQEPERLLALTALGEEEVKTVN